MSNHHFFPDDDGSEDVTDEEREYFRKQCDYEDESNCPSCNFVLSEHSVKQIVNCALNEIHSVLGVENK